MTKYILVPFFLSELIAAISFALIARFKPRLSKMTFLSHMPYEFFSEFGGFGNLWLRLLQLLTLVLGLSTPVYLIASFAFQGNMGFSFVLGLALVSLLYAVVRFFVSYVPLSEVRAHLLLHFGTHGLLALRSLMAGLLLLSLRGYWGNSEAGIYVISVLLIVLGLIPLLIAAFSPKMKRFDRLDRVEENGEVVYKRPKHHILSMLEWGSGALGVLLSGLASVGFFLYLPNIE